MHFVLCGGVVDFNFFAPLNVPESPHAQAAEIKKAVGLATVVYESDSLVSAEDMFPFADLQDVLVGERKVFSPFRSIRISSLSIETRANRPFLPLVIATSSLADRVPMANLI